MSGRVAAYLAKRGVCGQWPADVDGGFDRAVVIPVLAEEASLFATLDGLARNDAALLADSVVICVVNHRASDDIAEAVIDENRRTLARLQALAAAKSYPFALIPVDGCSPGRELPAKEGVGLARRIGFDHGARLCPDGVLIGLDADTEVDGGYLEAIHEHFAADEKRGAAVLEYAHPIDDGGRLNEAMARYEIFLRYHVLGLAVARSPYAYHTLGSAMAFRSAAYVAAGGMVRKRAGEDFYFLQALAKLAPMGYIGETVVRPSARTSWRVPFGTGRALADAEGDAERLRTLYHPESYRAIGVWLAAVTNDLHEPGAALLERADRHIAAYLQAQNFAEAWDRIAAQCRDAAARRAQFHRWFDAFRTLKCLHHLRDTAYPNQPMADAAGALTSEGWSEAALDEDGLRTMVQSMRARTREAMTG